MDWQQFVSWAFEGLIAGAVVHASAKLTKLSDSVDDLNKRVATIIEKTIWHEKVLDRHEEELSKLRREEK